MSHSNTHADNFYAVSYYSSFFLWEVRKLRYTFPIFRPAHNLTLSRPTSGVLFMDFLPRNEKKQTWPFILSLVAEICIFFLSLDRYFLSGTISTWPSSHSRAKCEDGAPVLFCVTRLRAPWVQVIDTCLYGNNCLLCMRFKLWYSGDLGDIFTNICQVLLTIKSM